jgi:hypothetical protein
VDDLIEVGLDLVGVILIVGTKLVSEQERPRKHLPSEFETGYEVPVFVEAGLQKLGVSFVEVDFLFDLVEVVFGYEDGVHDLPFGIR